MHDYNQQNGKEKFDEIFGPEGKLRTVLQKKAKWMEKRVNHSNQHFFRPFPSASLQMVMGQEKAFLLKNQAYSSFYKVQHQSVRSSSQSSAVEYYAVKYFKYNIHVPMNKQQAVSFAVHPSVSLWAQYMLKIEGWQLVRNSPGTYVRRNGDFQVVKEEEINEPYVLDSSDLRRNRRSKANISKYIPQMKIDDS